MGWLDSALTLVSIGGSAYNSLKQSDNIKAAGAASAAEVERAAKDNAEISRYDADVIDKMAREQAYATGVELLVATRTMNKQMKALKSSAAKSGIALSGTVKDVEKYSQDNFISDLEMIKYNGKKAEDQQRDLADRYRLLADKGLRESAVWAGTILQTASDKANASLMLGMTDVVSKLSVLAENWEDETGE